MTDEAKALLVFLTMYALEKLEEDVDKTRSTERFIRFRKQSGGKLGRDEDSIDPKEALAAVEANRHRLREFAQLLASLALAVEPDDADAHEGLARMAERVGVLKCVRCDSDESPLDEHGLCPKCNEEE